MPPVDPAALTPLPYDPSRIPLNTPPARGPLPMRGTRTDVTLADRQDGKVDEWNGVVWEVDKSAPTPAPKGDSNLAVDTGKTFGGALVEGGGAAVRGVVEAGRAIGGTVAGAIDDAIGTNLRSLNKAAVSAGNSAAEGIEGLGSSIKDSRSQSAKDALAGSAPKGNILDPEDWKNLSFGDNPTLKGYFLQGVDLIGQMAPQIIAAVATRGASVAGQAAAGAVVGGATGAGQAAKQARDYIDQQSDADLAANSKEFAKRIETGMPAAQARAEVKDATGMWAAMLTAPVSTVGGAATGTLLGKAGGAAISNAAKGTIPRALVGGGLSAAEESIQEVGEGVATNLGTNVGAGTNVPLGEGSFANATLGALGGFGPGAMRGAIARGPLARAGEASGGAIVGTPNETAAARAAGTALGITAGSADNSFNPGYVQPGALTRAGDAGNEALDQPQGTTTVLDADGTIIPNAGADVQQATTADLARAARLRSNAAKLASHPNPAEQARAPLLIGMAEQLEAKAQTTVETAQAQEEAQAEAETQAVDNQVTLSDAPDFEKTFPRPQVEALAQAGRDSMFAETPEADMPNSVQAVHQEVVQGIDSDRANAQILRDALPTGIDPRTGKPATPERLTAMRDEIATTAANIEGTLAKYENEFGTKARAKFEKQFVPDLPAIRKTAAEAAMPIEPAEPAKAEASKPAKKTVPKTTAVATKAPTTDVTAKQSLLVTMNGKTYPVESLADAAQKWTEVRDKMGADGGVSQIGNGVQIHDPDGKLVGRISYNGRIWDADDKPLTETGPESLPATDWTADLQKTLGDVRAQLIDGKNPGNAWEKGVDQVLAKAVESLPKPEADALRVEVDALKQQSAAAIQKAMSGQKDMLAPAAATKGVALSTRATDGLNSNTSRTQFDAFASLGDETIDGGAAFDDAAKILGFSLDDLGVTVVRGSAFMDPRTPMRFMADTREVEINPKFEFNRGQAAQYAAEEMLHATDVLAANGNSISATSGRLGRNGDIRRELQSAPAYAAFFEYPLSMRELSEGRMRAELYARLGTLYFGEPERMRAALPRAYEVFHEIFGRDNRGIARTAAPVRGEVGAPAGQPVQVGSGHGPERRAVSEGVRRGPQEQGSRLEGLQRQAARTLRANPSGTRVDRALEARHERDRSAGAAASDARGARAGQSTLRGAVLLKSLVEVTDSDRPIALERLLRGGGEPATAGPDGPLNAVFRQPEPAATPEASDVPVYNRDELGRFAPADMDALHVGSGLDVAAATEIVDGITATWRNRPETVVVADFDSLPAAIREDAADQGSGPGDVLGVFHDGKLYLVADAHAGRVELEATLFHEAWGHYGLRSMFGDSIVEEMASIFDRIGGVDRVLAMAGRMGVRVEIEGVRAAMIDAMKNDPRMTEKMVKRTLVEELVAYSTEKGRTMSAGIKEFIGAVRAWLRKHGFADLAKFNDADLAHLIASARDAVVRGKNGDVQSGIDPSMFAIRRGIASARINEMIRDARAGRLKDEASTTLGTTPDALVAIGEQARDLAILGKVINKIVTGKHQFDMQGVDVGRVVESLDRPLFIFDSSTEPGARVMVTSHANRVGEPVIVAIHVAVSDGRAVVDRVASMYGKSNANVSMKAWAENGLLRYVGNEEAPTQSTTPLTLLRRDVVQAAQGYIETVKTEADIVNKGPTLFRKRKPGAPPTALDSYRARAKKVVGWMDATLSHIGKMPGFDDYLKTRYETLGKVSNANDIGKKIGDTFAKATPEDSKAAYAYLTTKGATPDGIKNPAVRDNAVLTKRIIGKVGDDLVARGLLNPESREEYRDSYLPRLYLKHLLPEGDFRRSSGSGKKPSDMGYLKARQDIDEETRRVLLGEILDPGYLAAMAVSRPMRDMALLDFLEQISRNDAWVMKQSLVDWKGRRVTPSWLAAEARWMRTRADYANTKTKADALKIADQMEQAAAEGLSNLSGVEDMKAYKQMPDSPRYGQLRGLWVREEIFDDIVGVYNVSPADMTFTESMFGAGGVGTQITRAFKMAKVTLNPPAQIRNVISNMVMLHLSGIPMARVPQRVVQAAKSVLENGYHWKVAKKYGLSEATFAAQEVGRIETRMLEAMLKSEAITPIQKWKATAQLLAAPVLNTAGDAYQFMEAVGKTAKLIDGMEREKLGEAEAALEAHKWLFDYSLVSREVRYARNAPFGSPFLTWTLKVIPRLVEVATLHPQRLLPYVGLMAALPYLAASALGGDVEDIDKFKKALPDYLRKKSHLAVLPWRDSEGRVQVIDLGGYMPWTMWADFGKAIIEGQPENALKSAGGGFMGGPIPQAISALLTGVDPFTERPIANPGDPPYAKAVSVLNFVYNIMAPPIVTNMGLASPVGLLDQQYGGKIVEAATGKTNRRGDPPATPGQTLAYPFGMTVKGVDPDSVRSQQLQTMAREIQDVQTRLKSRLSNRALTDEQKQEMMADYQAEMKSRYEKLLKYQKETDYGPAMKRQKVEN